MTRGRTDSILSLRNNSTRTTGASIVALAAVAWASPAGWGFVPPSNDVCTSPTRIDPALSVSYAGVYNATTGSEGQNNLNCPSPDGPPAFGSLGIESDVWFLWAAQCNGHAEISTCVDDLADTKIAVYGPTASCPTESDQAIACNDDACGPDGFQSFVSFDVQCCEQFLVQIGKKPGTSPVANASFTITCVQDPGQAECAPTVACCMPDGLCLDVEPDCCVSLGGVPSTLATSCLGHGDDTTVDDACACMVAPNNAGCAECPGAPCRPTKVLFTDFGTHHALECACESAATCFPAWPSEFPSCDNQGCGIGCVGQSSQFNLWDVTYECRCAPPCASYTDCTDEDVCTSNRCFASGECSYVWGKFGELTGNGIVNLDDILCVLSGFSSTAACPAGDIAPNCAADGRIALDDILAVIGAFSGVDPCGCPN